MGQDPSFGSRLKISTGAGFGPYLAPNGPSNDLRHAQIVRRGAVFNRLTEYRREPNGNHRGAPGAMGSLFHFRALYAVIRPLSTIFFRRFDQRYRQAPCLIPDTPTKPLQPSACPGICCCARAHGRPSWG
jgi:hypothetical protein